ELAVTGPQLHCDDCFFAVGANEIRFTGAADETDIAVSLAIDAPTLGEIWPQLSGALTGSGRLSGTRNAPRFAGKFQGQRLRFADWSAASFMLESRATTRENLDVTASLTNLARGDTDLGSGTVRGAGQLNQLAVDIDWQVREVSLAAQASINRGEESIDGTVKQVAINEPATGTWSLAEAFSFRADTRGWQLDPHRWTGAQGELRVTRAEAEGPQIALAASLTDLSLQVANPYLPQNFRLQGVATADLDVTRRDGSWIGSLVWQQTGTVLTVLEAYDETTDVQIPRAELRAELRDGGAAVGAALSIEPGVTADLEFTLQELTRDTALAAQLRMQGKVWDWVPAILPQIDNFEGSIAASINASGPLLSPEFSGELSWREGRLVVPALNVPVDNIDLIVSGASDGAATLAGSARSGEGQLAVAGQFVDVMQSSRSVSLKLTGETAELINWPEYHVWASPDLVVKGTADGWTVNGALVVPRAEIAFRELPVEAVAVSPDVVVIGAEEPPVRPTRYSGEARLVLGERVHWDALGLNTRLSGGLRLQKKADRALTASGQVDLLDGVFEAYGQKLTIREGTLTFTGPLDDPIVNVRAVRVIETLEGTVTAGIHVRGRAKNLTSSVFSEPAMAEADALSYLVIGRPLSQATSTEGNELSGAALSLGIKQATRIAEQIGQTLGLDQLSLTGDGGDTTALVAGKQINPRTYARYSYGVFSRLGTLLLRYKLSRRLSLEAGTGEIQSLELLYSVETD
ncbi:MAG: translocation/assembly module TamB domain-containing protein, partial [Gammaproteobacteria bacterium]|nr:translocation/assembly module TamB domain-containing protein [Gammaproteobacteria bacterium]